MKNLRLTKKQLNILFDAMIDYSSAIDENSDDIDPSFFISLNREIDIIINKIERANNETGN